jgi:hypothetical protein
VNLTIKRHLMPRLISGSAPLLPLHAFSESTGTTLPFTPISRPIDETCDRFLFSIYMCITLLSYKTMPQTDTNTETGGCIYGEGILMMSA